ncbi:MAG: hypothetical protein II920_08000 [Clostridia bacterium]|nr:hypothetical protein [Clostridia bacterium]
MDMVLLMTQVLEEDAQSLKDAEGLFQGKSAARVIGEALARASMDGDIKAAAMLMELSGMDFRSRDSVEKHDIDRQKLGMAQGGAARVIIEDVRPEE